MPEEKSSGPTCQWCGSPDFERRETVERRTLHRGRKLVHVEGEVIYASMECCWECGHILCRTRCGTVPDYWKEPMKCDA